MVELDGNPKLLDAQYHSTYVLHHDAVFRVSQPFMKAPRCWRSPDCKLGHCLPPFFATNVVEAHGKTSELQSATCTLRVHWRYEPSLL